MTRRFVLALSMLAAVGCGDDDGDGGEDASMMVDSGMEDSSMMEEDTGEPPPPDGDPCESPREITLEMGEQEITGDTSDMSSNLELSMNCGSEPSPREVVALTIPGSGELGVFLNLAVDGTAMSFDTVMEVRPRACTSPADAMCFDDVDPQSELRSVGSFLAEGGDTVYVVVTGYAAANSGPWTMGVLVSEVNPPTIDSATVLSLDGEAFEISVDGSDPDGDVVGFVISFQDDEGNDIDVGMGQTQIATAFAENLFEMTSFTGTARFPGIDEITGLADAATATIFLVDRFNQESDPMEIDIAAALEVGDPCSDTMLCRPTLECDTMMCAIPMDVVTACDAAEALTLTPGAMTETEELTVSVPSGDGVLLGTCGLTTGGEALRTLTIPADSTYDLTVTTVAGDNNATMTDTVVYIQSTCGDQATQRPMGGGDAWCSDDVEMMDLRSTVEATGLTEGTYTIVVEVYGGVDTDTDIDLEVTLTPVLDMGEACDPDGAMNRCAGDPCPSSGDAICP